MPDAGIGTGAGAIRPGMTMPAVVLVARGGGRSGRNHGERRAADDGQGSEQAADRATMPIGAGCITIVRDRHSLGNRLYSETLTPATG